MSYKMKQGNYITHAIRIGRGERLGGRESNDKAKVEQSQKRMRENIRQRKICKETRYIIKREKVEETRVHRKRQEENNKQGWTSHKQREGEKELMRKQEGKERKIAEEKQGINIESRLIEEDKENDCFKEQEGLERGRYQVEEGRKMENEIRRGGNISK